MLRWTVALVCLLNDIELILNGYYVVISCQNEEINLNHEYTIKSFL